MPAKILPPFFAIATSGLRGDAFNMTNHVTFGAPNITPTNAAFGTITTQANSPRIVQLGARLIS